jgi:hypothetical protein
MLLTLPGGTTVGDGGAPPPHRTRSAPGSPHPWLDLATLHRLTGDEDAASAARARAGALRE